MVHTSPHYQLPERRSPKEYTIEPSAIALILLHNVRTVQRRLVRTLGRAENRLSPLILVPIQTHANRNSVSGEQRHFESVLVHIGGADQVVDQRALDGRSAARQSLTIEDELNELSAAVANDQSASAFDGGGANAMDAFVEGVLEHEHAGRRFVAVRKVVVVHLVADT